MNPLDFNYDRVALSEFLGKCQKLYNDEGKLVKHLRDDVNALIPSKEEKFAPSTFQKVLYGRQEHETKARYLKLLSDERLRAIAKFTSTKIHPKYWPDGLQTADFEDVAKWLNWREPSEVKEEASSDRKRYYIERVNTAAEENEALKSRVEALETEVKALKGLVSSLEARIAAGGQIIVNHPFSEEVANVLGGAGVSVRDDAEKIRKACEGIENSEAIFRMIIGAEIPRLDHIKGIDMAMQKLVGEGWTNAAIHEMLGAATLDPQSFALPAR